MLRKVEQIKKKNESAMVPCEQYDGKSKDDIIRRDAAHLALMLTRKADQCSVLVFSEANASEEERSRLYVRLFKQSVQNDDRGS